MTDESVPAGDLLASFPVRVSIPVAWGEMDVFGHVNNVVYFRYCESVRIAYLERIGLGRARDGDHAGPIVASAECRFRKPLVYPDTVFVGARAAELGRDRFTLQYRIVSSASGAVAAEGESVVVSYDYRTRTKTLLPAKVSAAIRALESGRPGE